MTFENDGIGMRFSTLIAGLILSMACLSGCAHYEFDLVRPGDMGRHVGEEREQIFNVPPLQYRMQAYEGRLVIKIYNPTNEIIFLEGARSSAVDPKGEGHPLGDLTLVPDSWVKLILPPLRPQMGVVGSDVGFGFGVVGERDTFYPGFDSDPYYYDSPRYSKVYIPGDSRYWNWEGQTDVRLMLFFRRTSGEFHQEFTFHRRKR
jgi:hypothetical protein